MCSSKYHSSGKLSILLLACILVSSGALAEGRPFVLGAGVEADSFDGISAAVMGDIQLSDNSWLSGSLGRTSVETPRRETAETWYGDIGIDHFFDPAGVRLSVGYWGDPDLLDATDVLASVYSRGEKSSLSFNLEYRDFGLEVPSVDAFQGRNASFSAVGLGLSGRIDLTENVSLRASGIRYEYDINFVTEESDRLASVVSVSRLSVLSSLIDYRVVAGVGVDVGVRRWYFDVSQWGGVIDTGKNVGATVSFMTPVSTRTDIEFKLGYDSSDLFGDVTIFSVFVYFYGG